MLHINICCVITIVAVTCTLLWPTLLLRSPKVIEWHYLVVWCSIKRCIDRQRWHRHRPRAAVSGSDVIQWASMRTCRLSSTSVVDVNVTRGRWSDQFYVVLTVRLTLLGGHAAWRRLVTLRSLRQRNVHFRFRRWDELVTRACCWTDDLVRCFETGCEKEKIY